MTELKYKRLLAQGEELETLMQIYFRRVTNFLDAIERSIEHQEAARKHWLEIEARCDRLQAKIEAVKKELKVM